MPKLSILYSFKDLKKSTFFAKNSLFLALSTLYSTVHFEIPPPLIQYQRNFGQYEMRKKTHNSWLFATRFEDLSLNSFNYWSNNVTLRKNGRKPTILRLFRKQTNYEFWQSYRSIAELHIFTYSLSTGCAEACIWLLWMGTNTDINTRI